MRKVLKWIGIGLGSVIVLALIAGGSMAMIGRGKVNRVYPSPTLAALRTDDPAIVTRGRHVAIIHGCTGCHGENLGGTEFLDIPPGKIIAPNLTRGEGGVAPRYRTAQDWDRAIRHGLRPDGRALLPFMPWATFNRLGDSDAAALIAYVQQIAPVDNPLPATELRLPGYLMAAMLPLGDPVEPPAANRVTEPEPTAAYGQYIASHTCVECHGQDLQGGKHPGGRLGPNLAGAGRWSLEEFARAVRQGEAPGGRRLDPDWMPWEHFAELNDLEVQALHAHLASLPLATAEE